MADSSFAREKSVFIAKLAEKAERYDETAETMKNVATTVAELTADERILLSEAYKKKICARRASWRVLSSKLEKESNMTNKNLVGEYLTKVEAEMSDICKDVVSILDNHLIPSAKIEDPISGAFYYKMKGDYNRYLAEFLSGSAKKEAADEAFDAYDSAMLIATMEFPPTHPVRLDVALNFAVLHYEILGSTDSAIEMAENAFNEAISGLDLSTLNREAYKDRDKLMYLLKDNVMVWKAEKSRDAGDSDGDDIPPFELLSMRLL